jgi:ribosomal protein S25
VDDYYQEEFNWEQDENLERVSARIACSVLNFFGTHQPGDVFHVETLRQHVLAQTGLLAPASADRVLRDLRQRGLLNYEVINRKQSLYEIKKLHPRGGPDETQTVQSN